jgi:hypothetical protein
MEYILPILPVGIILCDRHLFFNYFLFAVNPNIIRMDLQALGVIQMEIALIMNSNLHFITL